MLGKTVLLVSRDRVGARRLAIGLRAAGNELCVADSLDTAVQLILARAVDLVLFDYSDDTEDTEDTAAGCGKTRFENLSRVASAARKRQPVIVLAPNGSTLSTLVCVMCDLQISHFVTSASSEDGLLAGIDGRELVVTVEKLLRDDFFGATKYLPDFGLDLSPYVIRGAEDRDELIECAEDYLSWLGVGRELRSAMTLVIDELVTNAVYNAPRDEEGNPRYASVNRREKIALDPWEYAHAQLGTDGRNFVFSIVDEFGALRVEDIYRALRRCAGAGDQIEQKDGGAGLGLYTILSSLDQLVINIDPGVRTEIIAVLDITKRQRRTRGHSLHMFTKPAPRDSRRAPTQDSIVLSPDLRSDMLSTVAQKRRGIVVPLTTPKRRHRTNPIQFVPIRNTARASSPGPEVDRLRQFDRARTVREPVLRRASTANLHP